MLAVRRVLANISTHMIFDDHDVTDDWNMVGPDSHRNRQLVGDNLGAVSLRPRDGVVVHRLLARRAGTTTPHTARLPIEP